MTSLEHIVREMFTMEFSEFGEDQPLIFPRDAQAMAAFMAQWKQLQGTLFTLLLGQGVSEDEARGVVGAVDEAIGHIRHNHPGEDRPRLRELAWDYFANHLPTHVRVLFMPGSHTTEPEAKHDIEKSKVFLERLGLDPTKASQPPNHPIWQEARSRLSKRLMEEADLLLRLDGDVLRRLGCKMPQRLFSGDDLKLFHEALTRVACKAGVDLSVPRRRCWDSAALANAMRMGGANNTHIDTDVTSMPDWKVFMLYRKLGFKGMEDCIAKIGPRRAFALVRLVSNLPPPQFALLSFPASAKVWANRVGLLMQTQAHALWQECELDVQYIGLDFRSRTEKSTWVTDKVPGPHEAVTGSPGNSYTSYFPEVHTLIFGPAPAISGGWLRKRAILSSPACVLELAVVCHAVRTYSGPPFQTESNVPPGTNPDPMAAIEASLRALDTWMREHALPAGTGPTTLSLLADALGTPVMPSLPSQMRL